MDAAFTQLPSELPVTEIPGSYGLPFLGPLKDRLDFFWFQGETRFWESRMHKYNSTVFRTNVPPSPPGFPTSSVIMLLDQKSFPVLFDTDKVDKKDVLLANFMPSRSYYGGIRPCIYLDPSEERHFKIKSFALDLIKSNAHKWIPEFGKAIHEVFPVWETDLADKGKAQFNGEASHVILNTLLRTVIGRDPAAPGTACLKREGPTLISIWSAQLAPVASIGLPHLLEEILLHTFPIPFFIVAPSYRKLEKFFKTYAPELLDLAEDKYGLEREDALQNLIFMLLFNAYGGLNILFPSIMRYVGEAHRKVHEDLVIEVREAVKREGGITPGAIQSMHLTRSIVYEVLRMAPPVPYQYARAKKDLLIESHDACFKVKKGEIIGGCQPFAMRDPVIFQDPNTFNAYRFTGEGAKLVQYVFWANGPGTGQGTPDNKQCAGSDLVLFLAQLFLANFFLRYEAFSILEPVVSGSKTTVVFSSLTKTPDATPY